MSALAWRPWGESPSDQPVQADGGLPPTVEVAAEEGTPETPPTPPLPPKVAHGRSAVRPASSHHPVRDTFSQELNRGIQKLADRRYEIKRSTLELALANLGLLARSVRVMPEVRDGRAFGFRLFAIKADGPFARLGLRNDDILVSINGLDLATPDSALDAYGKLKQAPRLVLGLIREQRESTHEYTIR